MKTKSIIRTGLVTASILLIPFLTMLFNIGVYDPGSGFEEINWGVADFIVAGALLFGTGLAYELMARKMDRTSHRVVLGLVLLAALFLVWAELAVGIFNIPGISGS